MLFLYLNFGSYICSGNHIFQTWDWKNRSVIAKLWDSTQPALVSDSPLRSYAMELLYITLLSIISHHLIMPFQLSLVPQWSSWPRGMPFSWCHGSVLHLYFVNRDKIVYSSGNRNKPFYFHLLFNLFLFSWL